MNKKYICKILAISICFLFIGVSVSSATSNNNLLKIRDNIKKLKNVNDKIKLRNVDNENFKLFENIKDLLDKTNNAIFLLFAINFFILYLYFSHNNNQEWAKYSFNMVVFCIVWYFIS